ncbi:MAG: photosynthetic reaction center subunit H [Burkholderiales bacterium]|nr:MAG: photosynthetic reaction center subunit H [Burkholderiales bacterium]
MQIGASTGYLDLPQIILYMFWLFFAGIIFYLVLEGHREGYPMESEERPGSAAITGWPIPSPKTFKLVNGKEVTVPELHRPEPPLATRRDGMSFGNPYIPTGDLMTSGVGAGAYAMRADVPDMDLHGQPIIRPLRVLTGFDVSKHDTDPRGLPVLGTDNEVAGKVIDMWVDTCEMMFRFIEIEIKGSGEHVLLPVPFARIKRDSVKAHSIYAAQFVNVPKLQNADQVTMLEEEKISAYYGAGTLYADPLRAEPLL